MPAGRQTGPLPAVSAPGSGQAWPGDQAVAVAGQQRAGV